MTGDVEPGIDRVTVSQMLCAPMVHPLSWCPPPRLFLFLHGSLGQANLEAMTCPALFQEGAPGYHQILHQHHQDPSSDGKKQVRPLASMGSKYSAARQGKEVSRTDPLESIPCPGGTAGDRPPAQRSLSSRDLARMEGGGALLQFHLLKRSRD